MFLKINTAKIKTAGFALPSVLVVSLILIMMALVAVSAMTGLKASIDQEYYGRMARMAAESGIKRANYCLDRNNYIAQWSDASPLHPNTDCTGGPACNNTSTCFMVQDKNVRTTYEVQKAVPDFRTQTIKVIGKVEIIRSSSGKVWKSYERVSYAKVNGNVSFRNVTFGYSWDGAFFATIGSDGVMRTVGNNAYGRLGSGDQISSLTPREYAISGRPVSAFASFLSQGLGLFTIDHTGAVWGSGRNDSGQLGIKKTSAPVTTPTKVALPTDDAVAVAVGTLGYSNFVITNRNNIYSFGSCDDGKLGTGCTGGIYPTPTRVQLPAPNPDDLNTLPTLELNGADPDNNLTADIVGDAGTAYVRMRGGRVYGWGNNNNGQLADGTTIDRNLPLKIGNFGDAGFPQATQLAFDGDTVYILDSNGDAWAAGRNDKGQFGESTATLPAGNVTSLRKLSIPDGSKVTKVVTDQWFVALMTESGNVYTAGINGRGELGSGTVGATSAAMQQFILPAGVKAEDVYVASLGTDGQSQDYNNTFVIGDNGRVYGSGSNKFGQLGHSTNYGTTNPNPTPLEMTVLNGNDGLQAKEIRSGFGTTVIITQDAKVYTVGNNNDGQLGDGTNKNSYTPAMNKYTNVFPTLQF